MAYDKNKIYEQSIDLIKEHNLYFIEDVVSYLPLVKSTFYDLFPNDSNESNAIKKELEQNKVNTKVQIRRKLADGKGATELIALYKLIATDDERKKLSSTFIDHSSGGKELKSLTAPEREQRIKELKAKLGMQENDE